MQSSDPYAQRLRAEIAQAEERQAKMKAEIEREAARIKGLLDALAMYQETKPEQRGTTTRHSSKLKPVSAFGFVLEQIKSAGPRGLTIDEMVREAEAAEIKIKRPSLRSQLFDRKQKGMLIHRNGRYSLAPESDAADGDKAEGPDVGTSSPSIQ